jgi:nitrate reductase NapE component
MRKKLSVSFSFFQHRWPVLAIGFVDGYDFIVCVWFADVRISFDY